MKDSPLLIRGRMQKQRIVWVAPAMRCLLFCLVEQMKMMESKRSGGILYRFRPAGFLQRFLDEVNDYNRSRQKKPSRKGV